MSKRKKKTAEEKLAAAERKRARKAAKEEASQYRPVITENLDVAKHHLEVSFAEQTPMLLLSIAQHIAADIEKGIPDYGQGRKPDLISTRHTNPSKMTLGQYFKTFEKTGTSFKEKRFGVGQIVRNWNEKVCAGELNLLIPSECQGLARSVLREEFIKEITNTKAAQDYRMVDFVFDEANVNKRITIANFVKRYLDANEVQGSLQDLVLEKQAKYQRYLDERAEMLSSVPDNYAEMYPEARKIKRHFVLHVGPTNSGKTHDAVLALEKAGAGAYLAPLRLLAAEQYERLTKDGFICNLRTGEEEKILEDAPLLSATVEMADIETRIPCAVIDECQLIENTDRGGAWSTAILGLQADEIHLCLAPSAENSLVRLIEMCRDTYEIIHTKRKTPLVVEQKGFEYPWDIQPGDALIVFSRKNVHAVGAELQKKGYKVSVIYGALPPDVRNKQAENFRTGKTDIVVSTDAIGMGMNLPIRRVVFLEHNKFDGNDMRWLKPEEIKQIAGRAGRFGIYDTGYVSSFGVTGRIVNALNAPDHEVKQIVLDFPKGLIRGKVLDAVKLWQDMHIRPGFAKADTTRLYNCVRFTEQMTDDTELVYELSTMAFDWNDTYMQTLWGTFARAVIKANDIPHNFEKYINTNLEKLKDLEYQYKKADLLYAFARRFGTNEDKKAVTEIKAELSEKMITILGESKLESRKCTWCGKMLPWNHPYGMCDKCYRSQRDFGNYGYYMWPY